ncbi:MAG: hypothetical protein M0Q90_03650 [Bacteroidales bacterium]|nr:hypothetical protein [Bacteroidales bacterium]
MKKTLILVGMLLAFGFANSQDFKGNDEQLIKSNLKFSDLTENEKAEAIKSLADGNCYYNGIKLWGKVQFVSSFPDIKIQYVDNFPDIKVKFVTSFPDECGLWQITESFPDFKVQVVTSFPDIKIKVVESFPGVD